VAACPTHALQFVDRESVREPARRLAAVSIVAPLVEGSDPKTEIAKYAPKPKPGQIKGRGRRVVVIGSNAAGAMAALHAADAGAKVTLIAADAFSYRRPAIPSLIEGHIRDLSEAQIYPIETFTARGIEVRCPATAIGLDTAKKTITVRAADGKTSEVAYDSAVLATGGIAPKPSVPGADKRGVYPFTNAEGAMAIVRSLEHAKSAVVIGAGFIALEVAEALLDRGLKVYFNVRSRILRRLLEDDLSKFLATRFRRHGLEFLEDEAVSEIGGGEAVEYVVHKGRRIPVELVVLGTGVGPNAALAKAAGIQLAKSGAIAVDNCMRTSAANVYAAGDCAEVPDAQTGRFVYSAVGSTGALAGIIAGSNAAGGEVKSDGFLRAQADRIMGLDIFSVGHSTTTAAEVGLEVKVHDLPTPAEVDRAEEEVLAKLLTDSKDRIVGAQAVTFRYGSQYAWQLYWAVLMNMDRRKFLERWMSPRRRAAKMVEEMGWGELVIDPAKKA